MLKSNIKKIIVCLIAILLVVSAAYTTFATDGNQSILDEINEMLQEENGNIAGNENPEEIPEGTNENVNEELNTNINEGAENTNVNENLPETTPHAGIGDYTGLIFVAIFTVSAVYAYKKVREYNA